MRLRNVKNAYEKISVSPYFIEEPTMYKGKWKELFDNMNPIEIEIGMGKGNFIISKALDNPNINYIGIEKYNSVLLRAIEKLNDIDIPNLKIINFDACNINELFIKEIDKIYLNFSDPWPKKKHAKRRLTHKRFLDNYEGIVKKDVVIEMKTDNDDLFLFSKEELKNNGYELIKVNEDYGLNKNNKCKTEYEEKFIKLGKNINYLYAKKSLQ